MNSGNTVAAPNRPSSNSTNSGAGFASRIPCSSLKDQQPASTSGVAVTLGGIQIKRTREPSTTTPAFFLKSEGNGRPRILSSSDRALGDSSAGDSDAVLVSDSRPPRKTPRHFLFPPEGPPIGASPVDGVAPASVAPEA